LEDGLAGVGGVGIGRADDAVGGGGCLHMIGLRPGQGCGDKDVGVRGFY
jgi:hypothetical protein